MALLRGKPAEWKAIKQSTTGHSSTIIKQERKHMTLQVFDASQVCIFCTRFFFFPAGFFKQESENIEKNFKTLHFSYIMQHLKLYIR